MPKHQIAVDLLQRRWESLCKRLEIGDGAAAWSVLDAGYGESTRHYHDWRHVATLLEWFDEMQSLTQEPDAVELAIWFHDVVYQPKRQDNEAASAEVAMRFLNHHCLAAKVQTLIMATKHAADSWSGDAALICDIDLSILGADQADYDKYADSVRAEYAWVPEQDYRTGRSRILQAFLQRSRIFSTPVAREKWERQARSNLTRELSRLSDGSAC